MSDVSDFTDTYATSERVERRILNKGLRNSMIKGATNSTAHSTNTLRKAMERADALREPVPVTLPKLKFLGEA